MVKSRTKVNTLTSEQYIQHITEGKVNPYRIQPLFSLSPSLPSFLSSLFYSSLSFAHFPFCFSSKITNTKYYHYQPQVLWEERGVGTDGYRMHSLKIYCSYTLQTWLHVCTYFTQQSKPTRVNRTLGDSMEWYHGVIHCPFLCLHCLIIFFLFYLSAFVSLLPLESSLPMLLLSNLPRICYL